MMIGPFLMIGSLFYIFFRAIKVLQNEVKTREKIIDDKEQFYKKTEKIILKSKLLKWVKEELQLRYGVINSNTEKQNRIIAIKTMIRMTIISTAATILAALVIKVWYLMILLAVAFFIFPYVILFMFLNFKLIKLKEQFSNALNVFITKYTSDKNKDKALQRTYQELQYPMKYEFMRLSRRMANKSDVRGAVRDFSRRVNYIWAEVFGELLIMNQDSVENIGDELNELSIIMLEDQAIEADKQAEINSDKSINLFMAFCMVIAVLVNLSIFKEEAINIYFERYIGIMAIAIAIVSAVVCISLTMYFSKT